MKIANAKLYEEQIKRKFWEIWYDEKYQFYFGGSWRSDFSLADNPGGLQERGFAVLSDEDELLGYISYSVDNEMRIAQWFGAINFSNDKITFGLALRQVIKDCFLKFGMEVVEWNVICGNPIERSYDKMCEKLGGRIVGIRHRRTKDLAGNVHDNKLYEILRDDFLRTIADNRKHLPLTKTREEAEAALGGGQHE